MERKTKKVEGILISTTTFNVINCLCNSEYACTNALDNITPNSTVCVKAVWSKETNDSI